MKINGRYPVENGLSCFADFATFRAYEAEIKDLYKLKKDGDFYNEVLDKHFKINNRIPKSSRGEDWANYQLKSINGNIIMFASGGADGLYPRYVGYDKNGNVVKLVTDFIQLKSETEE